MVGTEASRARKRNPGTPSRRETARDFAEPVIGRICATRKLRPGYGLSPPASTNSRKLKALPKSE